VLAVERSFLITLADRVQFLRLSRSVSASTKKESLLEALSDGQVTVG
jgi:hypothetical protein